MSAEAGYELQREPVEGALAVFLGAPAVPVDLRELTYGELQRAMYEVSGTRQMAQSVLAATLAVNGEPIGLDELDALPGRFARELGALLTRTMAMHGLLGTPESETPAGEA
jgi:hypothetical protein